MSFWINFITNDDLIRSNLSQSMNESPNNRYEVLTFIPDDFCKNVHNLVGTMREQIMDTKNTLMFVNGGDRILGLIIFKIIQTMIMVETICVPEAKKGFGRLLLDKVKEFAKKMGLSIYLFPIDESIQFYVKNGFKEYKGGVYAFSASGGKKKTMTKRKKRKSKSKTRTHA